MADAVVHHTHIAKVRYGKQTEKTYCGKLITQAVFIDEKEARNIIAGYRPVEELRIRLCLQCVFNKGHRSGRNG